MMDTTTDMKDDNIESDYALNMLMKLFENLERDYQALFNSDLLQDLLSWEQEETDNND